MNRTLRLIGVAALAALVAAAPALAARPGGTGPGPAGWLGDQQQTEKFAKTVPLAKGGAVIVANVSGDITITGGAGDQVVIDAVKHGKTADDLKALEIEVTSGAGRVEIRAQYPRERRNINASVDFTIALPRYAQVTVNSVSGDLKLATIDGAARAETVSGDVTVTSAAQLETAKSVSGDVRVESAGSDTDLTVASVSGDVSLRAAKARGIDMNSISGDVRMIDVTCERVKASSISGDMTFDGPLAKGGRYALRSHSGDVTIYTDGKSGFELNASTFSGDVSSAFELTSKFGGEADRDRPGRGPRRGPGQRVRGTYGDGGALLEVDAFSGNVRILNKATAKDIKK
jgi:DUF4097 and DUF4098 domain-containing protein YvlB